MPIVQHDEPRPGDVLRLYADMSQARALLGYEPRVSLADGLATVAVVVSRARRVAREAARATKSSATGTWTATVR